MKSSLSLEKILQEFERIAGAFSIQIRYEKGDFRGGMCKVRDDQVIIINKKNTIEQKVTLFAHELSKLELNDLYMIPAAREIIENKTDLSINQPNN